ncbi:MAG: aminopeptidase P family protein [Synergistaceae bacterium]|nr:aminopeptidase P family protein [Synergistaceae bacterium]
MGNVNNTQEKISRLANLRKAIAASGADGFIVFHNEFDNRPTIQYLSGFTGSTAVVVIGPSDARLIVDSRYLDVAKGQSFIPVTQISGAGRDQFPAAKQVILEFGIKKLGFEEDKLSLKKHEVLKSFGLPLEGFTQLPFRLRAVKGAQEVAALRLSARIAARSLESIVSSIHIGTTEKQVAALLFKAMLDRGATQLVRGNFIVASGERSAMPHGFFSDRRIENGDMVTIDFGALYEGYISDITRTFALGFPSQQLVDVYEIVREANERAIEMVSPDVTGQQVDAMVTQFITKKGYGENIMHSLGHGIGLDVHELPNLNKDNDEKLPVGAVVTVEPGIYIPGLGGVRIEDDVLVTENGREVLTTDSPKELRYLV